MGQALHLYGFLSAGEGTPSVGEEVTGIAEWRHKQRAGESPPDLRLWPYRLFSAPILSFSSGSFGG